MTSAPNLPADESLILPSLEERLFVAYRLTFVLLFLIALGVLALSWFQPGVHPAIWGLRLAKAAVLLTVAAILFRRRRRDPVAAMLSLSFLLWTISSSVDFSGPAIPVWSILLDRLRFLLFAFALLLFPDGRWLPTWTRSVATAIVGVFLLGASEAVGLLPTTAYLPLAIGCLLLAILALLVRFRAQASTMQKQQLKWVALGLVVGVSLILAARGGAAITARMAMPFAGTVVLEALFQLGIVVIALGFLTSLLRYRLYDAETAISRSAVYAALTLSLVATFAACEALIELLGQRYFGAGIGNVSGAIAAAIAAVMLGPLHNRISGWAEDHFQRDLKILKKELPEQLTALSSGASVRHFGAVVLPHIERAVHAVRIALWIDGAIVARRGMARLSRRRWSIIRQSRGADALLTHSDDPDFPLRMVLLCPFGKPRGWLLIGPRPDGSFYGKDDLDALAAIAPSLRHALFMVLAREQYQRAITTIVRLLTARIATLEMNLEGRQPRSNEA